MISSEGLAQISDLLLPGYIAAANWGKVWHQPIEQGTAFEWTILAALASRASAHGWRCSFPIFNYPGGKGLFILRNEIPLHHRAQVGHSAQVQHKQALVDRFFQAFIPKLVLEKNDKCFSVFREGCPYHVIMSESLSAERPDILILDGRVSPGFPKIIQNGEYVDFSFEFRDGLVISGRMRVKNSSFLPCVHRNPAAVLSIPVAGIIECSINKTHEVAQAQLQRYVTLYSSNEGEPPIIIVAGNDLSALSWPSATVNFSLSDINELVHACQAAADLIMSTLGIL